MFWKTIRPYLITIVVGMLIGAGIVYLATRGNGESERIIQELQAENRELEERLGEIQAAVDSVGAGIESAATEAGTIADGISGVIGGLDDSIKLLEELTALFGRIEAILASGAGPGPPG